MIAMKKNSVELFECQPLTSSELLSCNGGETPGQNTSFANDLAYYVSYAAFWTVDMIRAFGAGAAKGQKLRFQG